MLTVGWDGAFTTFSPELLGQAHPVHGPLSLGNVLCDDLVPRQRQEPFTRIDAEVQSGVARCRTQCKYFDFCLGGAPANKLGERRSFAGTTTMHCRLTQQAVVDCVLAALERDLATSEAKPPSTETRPESRRIASRGAGG
jgi:uncharacterized protein